jgi:light-regulated signal transduction histidine kinase (bacteriophytochrome)
MRAAMSGDRPYCVEFRAFSESGRVRWVRSQARLCQSPDGTARVIGVTEDITPRKLSEEALKRSNENLEQFAYMASHDLKEPLRMISGFAELLAMSNSSSLDAKSARYLEFLLAGARRMQRIVDDLLAFARMVGNQSAPFAIVDCNLALQTALASLRLRIEESKAQITSDPLPSIRGQASLLAQVFQNLLSNSMRYRKPSEPPCIHISAVRQGQQWVIRIADNGIGFDPGQSEQIFAAFFRLQGGDHSGSGMGLTLCRRIIEHHEGRIWAESEPGVGSTFFIALPAGEPAQPAG